MTTVFEARHLVAEIKNALGRPKSYVSFVISADEIDDERVSLNIYPNGVLYSSDTMNYRLKDFADVDAMLNHALDEAAEFRARTPLKIVEDMALAMANIYFKNGCVLRADLRPKFANLVEEHGLTAIAMVNERLNPSDPIVLLGN